MSKCVATRKTYDAEVIAIVPGSPYYVWWEGQDRNWNAPCFYATPTSIEYFAGESGARR